MCVWFLVAENEERGRGDSGRMEGGFPQTEGEGRWRYLPLVSLGLSLFSLALPHCANKQELGSGIGFSYWRYTVSSFILRNFAKKRASIGCRSWVALVLPQKGLC